jgi:hypothetical protein
MNNVERFENLMSFKAVDRLPMFEWAFYWDQTTDRWYDKGLDRNTTAILNIKKE